MENYLPKIMDFYLPKSMDFSLPFTAVCLRTQVPYPFIQTHPLPIESIPFLVHHGGAFRGPGQLPYKQHTNNIIFSE